MKGAAMLAARSLSSTTPHRRANPFRIGAQTEPQSANYEQRENERIAAFFLPPSAHSLSVIPSIYLC